MTGGTRCRSPRRAGACRRARAAGDDAGASLPVMPGFREMALRRSADAQAAQAAGWPESEAGSSAS